MKFKRRKWLLRILTNIMAQRFIFISLAVISGLLIAMFIPYPNMPLHPTLFVSLAIITGFAIAPLLAYVEDETALSNNPKNANILLSTTWFAAAFFGIALLAVYFSKPANDAETFVKALTPVGMIIAALIASASVIKNIAESRVNEAKKHAKEDSKFYLEKCIAYLKDVDELLGNRQNDNPSWGQAAIILLSMREISKKDYITEPSHQNIFKIEYTNARLKLLKSMIDMQEDKKTNRIRSSFFCSISDWKSKSLAEAFETDSFKINPKRIIVIMKYLQHDNNDFLNESSDYHDWRTYDLEEYKNTIPMKLAIEYIKMYKEKIPKTTKSE